MSYEIAWNETQVAFGKAFESPFRISQRLPFDISTPFDKLRDRNLRDRLEQGRFANRPYNKNRASILAMTVFDGSARRIHFWLPVLRIQAGDSALRGSDCDVSAWQPMSNASTGWRDREMSFGGSSVTSPPVTNLRIAKNSSETWLAQPVRRG